MEVKTLKGKTLFVTYKYKINIDMLYHNLQYTFRNTNKGMVFATDKTEIEIPFDMYNDLCVKGYHSNDDLVVIVDKSYRD